MSLNKVDKNIMMLNKAANVNSNVRKLTDILNALVTAIKQGIDPNYGFDIATCSSIMNRTKTSIRNLLKIYNSNINNKLYNDLYNNIDNACKNAMKNFIKEH